MMHIAIHTRVVNGSPDQVARLTYEAISIIEDPDSPESRRLLAKRFIEGQRMVIGPDHGPEAA